LCRFRIRKSDYFSSTVSKTENIMRRLPPLTALRVFEVVAREGGISVAAGQLGMTPGAVSKQVLKLEAWFGQPLFHRAGRGLQLAAVGAALLKDVTPALDRIELAGRRAEAGAASDRLCITAPPTFMTYWLIPRLGQFQRLHPDIGIQLNNRRDQGRALPEHTDVAIRRGAPTGNGLSVTAIMPEAITPACNPDMPGIHLLTHPRDLAHVNWLMAAMRPDDWKAWLAAADVPTIKASRDLTFDHTYLALGAAHDALGVAMAPLYLVTHELQAGRLLAPFPQIRVPTDGYFAVCDRAQENTPAIKAFNDWLSAQGREHTRLVQNGGAAAKRCNVRTDANIRYLE
jgi:LysR family glycine cleavage system transcriptional activator